MKKNKHFGLIDVMLSCSLIKKIEVDYNNSYPHFTDELNQWVNDNKKYVSSTPIAELEGDEIIVFIGLNNYVFKVITLRPDTIPAMVQLINIVKPKTQMGIHQLLKNVYHEVYLVN